MTKKIYILHFFSLFIIFLFIGKAFLPFVAHADTLPTEGPSPTVTDSSSPTELPTETPTPLITPQTTITPSPSPVSFLSASNSAQTTTAVTDASNTGGNMVTDAGTFSPTAPAQETPTSIPPTTPSPTTSVLQTGNATTTTTVTNTVNTQAVNSHILYQTINIFVNEDGTIDLSNPQTIASDILADTHTQNTTSNVLLTGDNNYASVDNSVLSTANTGDNTATNSGDMLLQTGNATTLVSLTNTVNVTLIDSVVHIITLNIYGNIHGNIILPTVKNAACTNCSISTLASHNNATLTNTVLADANSGDNSIESSDSAMLTTGNANTAVNIVNLINMLMYGVDYQALSINTFGTWTGNFLGWGNMSQANNVIIPASSSADCSLCSSAASSQNTADVHNTISAQANTGGNSVSSKNSTLTTGNANVFVGVTNHINSLLYNSHLYFGFINIFGNVTGDIGDANAFITPTPTLSEEQQITSDGITHREAGGKLLVAIANNVGAFVYPGDTVTITARVKNSGSGALYDAVLHLSLVENGVTQPVADFPIGTLLTGQGIRLATGFVLADDATADTYTIHATVTGTTGDEETPLSAVDDSYFTIAGKTTKIAQGVSGESSLVPTTVPKQAVLGVHTTTPLGSAQEKLYYWLGVVFGLYLLVRIMRDYRYFARLFAKRKSLKERLLTLRLLLL